MVTQGSLSNWLYKSWGWIKPLAFFLVILITFLVFYLQTAAAPVLQPGAIPPHPEIEERFGVRFTSINLTAQTGLIDVRYKVIDLGKATNFGHYTESSPLLIAEDSGLTVETMVMGAHNHRVEPGRIYYVLYRNTANAITPGSRVTIMMDNLAIEHIVIP